MQDNPDLYELPFMQSKPILTETVAYYLNAFYILSSFRSLGMGVEKIKLSEVVTYMDEYTVPNRNDFITIITEVDTHVVKKARDNGDRSKHNHRSS